MLNKKEEYIELDENARLSDLLNKLAEINGAAFKKDVYEPGANKIKTGFSITINGVFIGQLDGLDTKLAEGNNILLMSLMSGG